MFTSDHVKFYIFAQSKGSPDTSPTAQIRVNVYSFLLLDQTIMPKGLNCEIFYLWFVLSFNLLLAFPWCIILNLFNFDLKYTNLIEFEV